MLCTKLIIILFIFVLWQQKELKDN